MTTKKLKTCKNGHQFYKTSDCPVCPICAQLKQPRSGFMSMLSAPARRALESIGIKTLKQLSKQTETDLLKLHGFGPATLPILRQALQDAGLSFKK